MGIETALVFAIVSFVTAAATTAYQVIQAKKMKKEAQAASDARKGFEIVSEGQPSFMPIIYGRAKVGGIRTWAATSNSFQFVQPNSDRSFQAGAGGQQGYSYSYREWGYSYAAPEVLYEVLTPGETLTANVQAQPSGYMSTSLSGDRNEFLCYQQAICVGPISGVRDVIIDGSRYLDDPTLGTYGKIEKTTTKKSYNGVKAALRLDFHYYSTEADSIVATNFGQRADALFDGLVSLSAWFRIDRDDPQFSAIPTIQSVIEGRLVRTVTNGVLSTTLSYLDAPEGYVYDNSPPLCLLDYMLDNENGGGYSLDEVDLDSFEAAVPICRMIAQSGVVVGGKFWNPTDGQNSTSTRDLPLYECNIIIDTSKPVRDNLEALLATMGDARLVWSNGKYRLSIQYPATNEDIQVARVITDDDITFGEEVDIAWPNAQNRYNFATVRFHNEFEDFTEDSVSWPPKYDNQYKRGIGALSYPAGVGSWSASKAGGQLLNQYAVWNGQNDVANFSWLVDVSPQKEGIYTIKAAGDNRFSFVMKDPSGTVIMNLGSDGNFNESFIGEAAVNLYAGVYRIEMTGFNTDGEKVLKKGVAASISNGNSILWTTRNVSYSSFVDITEDSSVYESMLTEDNGVVLETNIFYDGVTDPYHALAKVEEIVRTSRSATGYTFHYTITSFYLEPGDFIKFESHDLGIGIDVPLYLRVETVKVSGENTCKVEATRFDYSQLAWNVKDDVYIAPKSTFMQVVPQTSAVYYAPPVDIQIESSGKVFCEPVSFGELGGYIFYVHKAGIDPVDNQGRPIFLEIARSPIPSIDLPAINAASAFFAVQVYSVGGRKSEYTVTDPTQAILLTHNWLRKSVIYSPTQNFVETSEGVYEPSSITLTAINLGFEAPAYEWFEGQTSLGTGPELVITPFEEDSRTISLRTIELTDVNGVGHITDTVLYSAPGNEPGATVGAPIGTNIGNIPVEEFVNTVEQLDTDLQDAKTDITDLFTTYGNTESSAANAALAAQSVVDAAAQVTLSEAARNASRDARDISVAAKDAIVIIEGNVNTAKGIAETTRDQAIAAQGAASDSVIAASNEADRAYDQAVLSADSADVAAGHVTTTSQNVDDAQGSASAAAAEALIAFNKARDAEDAADAAVISASQAGVSETNAGLSAAASNLSKLSASLSSRATYPDNFTDPSNWVANNTWGGTVQFVDGIAKTYNGGAVNGLFNMPIAAGQVYRLTARFRTVNQGGGVFYLGVIEQPSSVITWFISGRPHSPTVGLWETVSVDFTGDELLAITPSLTSVKIIALVGYQNISDGEVSILRIENITSAKQASNSAAAADLSRIQAVSAVEDAEGYAVDAFEQAGIAVLAKDDAQDAATAANISRDEASGFSGDAGSFANAASLSLLSAEVAASIVAPSTFQQDGRFFSHVYGDEITALRPEQVFTNTAYVATELGKVLRFYQPSTGYTIVSTRRRLRRTEHSRRFRLVTRARMVTNPAAGTARVFANLYGLAADYNTLVYDGFTDVQEGTSTALMTAAQGVVSVELEFSLSASPVADAGGNIADGCVVPSIVIYNDLDPDLSSGVFDIVSIELSDITEEYLGRTHAAASLLSSQSAAASSDIAGDKAAIAVEFAGYAVTEAGKALISEGKSATSESNAFDSAVDASDFAILSAESKDLASDFAEAANERAGFANIRANDAGISASAAELDRIRAEAANGTAQTAAGIADIRATDAGISAASASLNVALSAAYSNTNGITPNGKFDSGPELWNGTNMSFLRQAEPYGALWRTVGNLRGDLTGPRIPVNTSRRYRLNSRIVIHAANQVTYIGLMCYNAAGEIIGNVYMPNAAGQSFVFGQFYSRSDFYTGEAGTPPVFGVGNYFVTGTVSVVPIAYMNYSEVGGGAYSDVIELWLEDITDLHATATFAEIASGHAASASDSEANAAASEQLAVGYKGDANSSAIAANLSAISASDNAAAALISAGIASDWAGVAEDEAGLAQGRAAAAELSATLADGHRASAVTQASLSANYAIDAGKRTSSQGVPSSLSNHDFWMFTEGNMDMVTYPVFAGRRFVSTYMAANGLSMMRNRYPMAVTPGMRVRATEEVGNWNADTPAATHLSRFVWFVDGVRQIASGTNPIRTLPTQYEYAAHINEFTVPANCNELYLETYFEGNAAFADRRQFLWWAVKLEDVTSERASLTSATAAEASAALADEHQASAFDQAELAASYVRDAEDFADAAASSADAAEISAAFADGKGALAETQANLSAKFAREANAYSQTTGITPNGKFDSGPELWEAGDMVHSRAAEPFGAFFRSYGPAIGTLYSNKIPIDVTRKYKLNVRFVTHVVAQTAYAGFQCYDSADNYLGNVYMPSVANQSFAGGEFHTRTEEFTGQDLTAPVFVAFNSFITGTTKIRLLFLTNYANAASSSYFDVLELWMDDITEVKAAQASATAASGSAASANDQRALAQAAASLSADYAGDALAHAGTAFTQAGIATDKAAAATATSNLVARINTGSINANPNFLNWPSGQAYPSNYSAWVSGPPTKITDYLGNNFARFTSTLNVESGMGQFQSNGLENVAPGKYLLDIEVTLMDGTWPGAGILVYWFNDGSIVGLTTLNFMTDKDINNQFGVLPYLVTKRYIKTITAPANTNSAQLYVMANWSGFGNGIAYKVIDFKKVAFKAATAADAGFSDLEASVTVLQGAIANAEGAAAYYETIVAASGSDPAVVSLKAGKNGSSVNLSGNKVIITNPINGQQTEVARFENGVAQLNSAMIRTLRVAPRTDSQIFLPVMLRPIIRLGSDGQAIQYQNGESFGAAPERIVPEINSLPSLATGESYDIRAINITATGFTAYAKKLTAAEPVTQTTGAGTDVGGTPKWRVHKPTILDAYNGNYQFSLQVIGLLVDSEPAPGEGGGYYFYAAVGNVYAADTSGNMQIVGSYNEYWGGLNASGTRNITVTVNTSMAIGQTGGHEFGLHATQGTVAQFYDVVYATQVQSNVTAVGGAVSWVITPPAPN